MTAVVSHNTSGDNAVIAAPTDGYIAIDHINFVPTSAVGVTFKSGVGGTATPLSGTYPLTEKQPVTLENTIQHQDGVITCKRNEAFNISLDAGQLVSGFIRYRIIGA